MIPTLGYDDLYSESTQFDCSYDSPGAKSSSAKLRTTLSTIIPCILGRFGRLGVDSALQVKVSGQLLSILPYKCQSRDACNICHDSRSNLRCNHSLCLCIYCTLRESSSQLEIIKRPCVSSPCTPSHGEDLNERTQCFQTLGPKSECVKRRRRKYDARNAPL